MRKILLFLLFTNTHLFLFANIGMGDGCCGDYGKVSICFGDNLPKGNGPSISGFEEMIPRIRRFYEYKSHIIGQYQAGYFIFNASSITCDTFKNIKDWEFEVEGRGLKPKTRTKWIDPNYDCTLAPVFLVIFPAIVLAFVITLIYILKLIITIFFKKDKEKVKNIILTYLALAGVSITILIVAFYWQSLGSF